MNHKTCLLSASLTACALLLAGCGGDDDEPGVHFEKSPECAMTYPLGGDVIDVSSIVTVLFNLSDPDSTTLTYFLAYSTDGGLSFPLCTRAGGGPNPIAGAPQGDSTFDWDVSADLGGATLPLQVRLGLGIDDTEGAVGRCFTFPGPGGEMDFTVVRPQAQPTCAVVQPMVGACVDAGGASTGRLDIELTLADVNGDAVDLTVCFSTDGGTSFAPITIAAASSGALVPFTAASPTACATAGPGQISDATDPTVTITWDARVDGVGASGCENVLLRISPEDGMGAVDFSACERAFQVSDIP